MHITDWDHPEGLLCSHWETGDNQMQSMGTVCSLLLSGCSGNSVFLVKSITFHPLVSARSHAVPACQENLHNSSGVNRGSDAEGSPARRWVPGPGLGWELQGLAKLISYPMLLGWSNPWSKGCSTALISAHLSDPEDRQTLFAHKLY